MSRYLNILGGVFALLVVFFLAAWITVWLGTAGKSVTVPDLHDKNVVDALKQVGKIGLDLRVVREEYSAVVPRNEIITQYPKAGTELKVDRNIEVVLSLGQRDIAIPDVRGISLRKAELILQQNGIFPGRTTRIFSADEEGAVLSQNPMPLARNIQENAVDLLVSAGPRPPEYRMPDLIGRNFSEASALLESGSLMIGNVRYEEYPGAEADQITNQFPQFGYPVSRETPVVLVVNKGNAAPPGATVARVPFAYRVPFRIPFPVALDVYLDDQQGRRRIFTGRKMPATLLELTLEISGAATVEVYLNGEKVHVREYK